MGYRRCKNMKDISFFCQKVVTNKAYCNTISLRGINTKINRKGGSNENKNFR